MNKILITGSSGFLGRHLVNHLRECGYENLIEHRGSRDVDLRDQFATEHYFRIHNPDIVIHLSAKVGGIFANKKSPGSFFYDNMMMGLNTIEAARKINCKKFILIGTVCSYPKFTSVPFNESDLWLGYPEETNASYGVAKRALYQMLDSYRKEYRLNGISLLPANLYGPGDSFDLNNGHVIPALIKKFDDAGDGPVGIWGTGKATREFLYVEDCAKAIVMAMEKYNEPEPVNIGTGQEITISALADQIAELMDYKGDIVWEYTKPDGQPRRKLNCKRAFEKFGFRATTNLTDGLIKTINWYRGIM